MDAEVGVHLAAARLNLRTAIRYLASKGDDRMKQKARRLMSAMDLINRSEQI